MRYFIIILLLIGAITVIGISVPTIEAVPPLDSQFIYDSSEMILIGRVTSVNSTFSPTHNLYQIEVEKFLKNHLGTDTVLAAGQNTVITKLGNQVFKPGDRVLFFLNNDTINYDKYTGIFGVSYESKLVEPQWDQCNIFEKSIPAEHWIFGGRGPMPKISQQNNTDVENFVVGKKILIAYDIFNHTPDEKNIDVGIQIKNLDDPNSLYIYTEISPHLLKACTAYKTLSWNFTPTKSGRYSVEFYDLRGSQVTIGFTAKEQFVPKSQYGDSPLKQFESGIPIDKIQCKEGLELILKSSGGSPTCVKPETKQKLIERGWTKPISIDNTSDPKYAEIDVTKKLLSQNQIEYIPDKIIVASGPLFDGDPRCGAVIDVNSVTHWFAIDSISKLQKMTIFSENPNPCKVNTGSCFCDVQVELTALTLDRLSYFSLEEEEKVANTLIDYLVKENINRTPKFMIGKFNLNYTDPSAIGYCGELWGYNTIDYFDGAIVNDQVKDYGLAKELSPLCAIAEGAKWWESK